MPLPAPAICFAAPVFSIAVGRLAIFFVFLCAAAPALAISCAEHGPAADYCRQLSESASAADMPDDPEWHALLQYRRRLFGGVESEIDDPSFFTAPDGKINPAAELAATIAGLFAAPDEDHNLHAGCRYPARLSWLKARLKIDPARLPALDCGDFKQWYGELNPAGLTLIFPTAYLNNPASMFGHTLLRIDGRGQDEDSRLLAYSANYAAATGPDGGMAFAFKGILGFYRGGFSVRPYYQQVTEYGDIEKRDIWEYQLNLTAAEQERVSTHLWELGQGYLDYYFFDENCSYQLLALLDYARPGMGLTERLDPWVIPSEAVRVVAETPNLVNSIVFRPSSATVLKARLDALGVELGRLSRALAEEKIDESDPRLAALGSEEKARVYELTVAYLDYLRLSGAPREVFKPALARRLMVARSALGVDVQPPAPLQPLVRPDQGHRTGRFAVGLGTEDNRLVSQLSLRPAYHEPMDPGGGYVRGAAINFLGIDLRQVEEEGLRLQRFAPIEILSLSPRNVLLRPWSWNLGAALERKNYAGGDDGYNVFAVEGGPGITTAFGERWLAYLLLNGAIEYSPEYGEGYWAFGGGPRGGLFADLSPSTRLGFEGRALRLTLGDDHTEASLALRLRLSINAQNAVIFSAARLAQFDDYWNEWLVSWNRYF